MLVADLYAYLLERKLVTPMFSKPREGLPSPGFDPSKKCELLENLVLYLIQNTQQKQQTWIYFIHDW